MTISPCTPAGTGLLLSSTTTTSYPGTGWVGEPGLTALASIPRLRAAMGQPVSVCHQWSMTGTDRTSRAHSYVVGSSRSPARNRARRQLVSWPCLYLPFGSSFLMTRRAVGAQNRAVSYTHLRAHETGRNLVCRLLLEKKKT